MLLRVLIHVSHARSGRLLRLLSNHVGLIPLLLNIFAKVILLLLANLLGFLRLLLKLVGDEGTIERSDTLKINGRSLDDIV